MSIARLWHFRPSSELCMPAVSGLALDSLAPSQENAAHFYTYLLNLQLLDKYNAYCGNHTGTNSTLIVKLG